MDVKDATTSSGPPPIKTHTTEQSSRRTPWQIWIVVVLLALEGLGQLLAPQQNPYTLVWIAFKCLFIVGLIKGWRWMFVLFLVIAGLHVIAFSMVNAIAAILNLVLVLLVLSALRYYFPKSTPPATGEKEPEPDKP